MGRDLFRSEVAIDAAAVRDPEAMITSSVSRIV